MISKSARKEYRDILSLAAPIILANLSIPLMGIVDTAILGHLSSPVYLGAVALGAQLMSLVFWAFGFLRMGTTSLAARRFGAEDLDGMQILLARSVMLALVSALLLLALQPWLIGFGLALIADGGAVEQQASVYARIRIWSAPATLINYCLIGWFIGAQNTRAPMWILMSINGINIVLDYVFIMLLGMNAAGAAWASLIAEYCGLAVALLLLWRARRSMGLTIAGGRVRAALVRLGEYDELLAVNRHLFVRTLALLLATTFFVAQCARLGDVTLAANAILLSLLALVAYGLDGIAHATEALAGKTWGAGDAQAFQRVYRRSMQVAVALAVATALALLLGKPLILALYTDIREVAQTASKYYFWLALIPVIGVWAYQYDGLFIGIGMTREMQYSMLAATLLVYLPVWWLTRAWGNHGLWVAYWSLLIGRAILQYLFVTPKVRATTSQYGPN